jgi:hypothetical protein
LQQLSATIYISLPNLTKPILTNNDWSFMLSATLITLITLLERLLANGTLTAALSALFKKALILLGAY